MDASLSAYWTNGSAYFKSNERFLENIRNDIGGHFGSKAAIYALENLSADAVGHMEFRGTGKEQTMHLHFAGELVATAMLRHLPGEGVEDRFHQITQIALAGSAMRPCAHSSLPSAIFGTGSADDDAPNTAPSNGSVPV